MKTAIILFVLMYVFIIFLPKYRMAAALGTAVLFMVLGILPIQAAPGAVNWNALMMMCGTMIIVYFFIDSGMPYDPLAKADPDITLSANKRQIGGLGIYLVKKTMDDVSYKYEDGHNILTIKKLLS